jgi:tetratricopeptide (TPR) repeat protein
MFAGCVYNVPLVVDPARDMKQAFPRTNKIPIKVGVYLSDDLKNYVYRQEKMGLTFQMNVGKYLPPIAMQMASTMFESVIHVNSPPPYRDSFKPDVEAVIVPEILYAHGNAVGILAGYIEAKAWIRITAYDLSGKILWQDDKMGESRSRVINFADAFLGGMEEVGQIGYEAAFAAAIKIINDFNARPPKELYSLLEIKSVANLKNMHGVSNFEIFQNYFRKGQFQYEKKNYYQALYSFQKAKNLNPDDLPTSCYIGQCYAFTGCKDKALEEFRRVVNLGHGSQEATDALKWIDLLRVPLKIGILNSDAANDFGHNNSKSINQALLDSRMYELCDVSDLKPLTITNPQKEWNQFLERCSKKGIKIVIISGIDSLSQKVRVEQQPGGDVATEYVVNISSKAYSAKKKEVKADIKITERTSTIREQTKEAEEAIKGQLLKNGAEKLVLRLLEHDIY